MEGILVEVVEVDQALAKPYLTALRQSTSADTAYTAVGSIKN
jgi:hypothetical protein